MLNWGNGTPALDPPPGGNELSNVASGIACANGKVYVSWKARNLISLYDAQSGALLDSWPVSAPERLCVTPDGGALVISEGKVLKVIKEKFTPYYTNPDKDGRPPVAYRIKISPLVSDHLSSPRALTLATDGTLFVANAGVMQAISVFDKEDGKYLRTIGKEGGRPRVGKYDANGVLEPGGIAIDKHGNLWVAETLDSPKRHSVWNATPARW